MKLNPLEFFIVNNPLRTYIQEHYEMKKLRTMSSIKNIDTALEIGCGNGSGTKLINKYFKPKNIIAIDIDPKMIEIAQKRKDKNTVFQTMDASKLKFPDNHFDAVFDFGVIHHIPNWKDCIREIARVLKPKGEIILEDLSIETFNQGLGKLWHALLNHPYDHMYTKKEFTECLKQAGFDIKHYEELHPLKLIRFFALNAENNIKSPSQ